MDREKLESECDWEFLRGSGPGGQNRNRRETAVRLTHRPTGIVVESSETRSQLRNRELALERLERILQERRKKKKKRIPTKPSRAAKRKRVERKRKQSAKKQNRKKPGME